MQDPSSISAVEVPWPGKPSYDHRQLKCELGESEECWNRLAGMETALGDCKTSQFSSKSDDQEGRRVIKGGMCAQVS